MAGGSVYGYEETKNKSFTSSKLPDGVKAQREDGINTLFVPKGKEIDLGDFSGTCLSNPNLCGNFTVSFLLKTDTPLGNERQIIFDSGQEKTAYGWTVTIKKGYFPGDHTVSGFSGFKNNLLGTSETFSSNNSWVHVAFVFDHSRKYSTYLKLFVNGNRSDVDSMMASSGHNEDLKTHLTLGSPQNQIDFSVAFFQFTEERLSPDEIFALYKSSWVQGKAFNCKVRTFPSASLHPSPNRRL